MPDTQLFELHMEAVAEVVRGCCGGNHEFGECPLDGADWAPPEAKADSATDQKEEDR